MDIISRINSGQNLEKMFVRTLSRLIDLYSDRSHFIHELMQNAEDVCASEMRFELYADRLEVLHDGRPFTEENLRGICDVGLSDKIGNVEQIGQFGIGFKAVFCICDVVRLYSSVENWDGEKFDNLGSFAIEIQDFIHPVNIDKQDIPKPYTTKFVFPFAVGKEYQSLGSCDDLASFLDDKLNSFDSCSLLFMRNLSSVTYVSHLGNKSSSKTFSLKMKRVSDDFVELVDDHNVKSPHYLRFSRHIEGDTRNVDIAYCVEPLEDGGMRFVPPSTPYLFIYFPSTTLSHLNFIVQGPYHTTPNRSTLPENDAFNDKLVHETALLFRDSVLELKEMKCVNFQFLSMLPLNPPASLYDSYTRTYRQKWMYDPIYRECVELLATEALIPTREDGVLADIQHSIIMRNNNLMEVFDRTLVSDLLNEPDMHIVDSSINLNENRELYDVLRSLKIKVMEVSSLPKLLKSNKDFLPSRDKDWLCLFYEMLADYPNLLRNEMAIGSFVNTPIILTDFGSFVCPRKNKVFEPSDVMDENYVYVDRYVFDNAHEFFKVLELGHPDILDSFIDTLASKYSGNAVIPYEDNVDDWKKLIDLLGVKGLTPKQKKDLACIKMLAFHSPGDTCKHYICGNYHADYNLTKDYTYQDFYMLISSKIREEIDLESLYDGVDNVGIVDFEEYRNNGVDVEAFNRVYDLFKVHNTIFKPMSKGWHYNAIYSSTAKVISVDPFNIDYDIWLSYDIFASVAKLPIEKARLKSKILMSIFRSHPEKIHGLFHERISDPIEKEGDCSLLANSKLFNWMFTSNGLLANVSDIDRHELDTNLYSDMPDGPDFYRKMGFKENVEDVVDTLIDDFYMGADEEKQKIFVEKIVLKHFGISTRELRQKIEIAEEVESKAEGVFDPDAEAFDEFPVRAIGNVDRLIQRARKYYAAAPNVKYEDRIIKHRISLIPDENKQYVQDMYEFGHTGLYACQMCGKPTKYMTSTQIDNNPEKELAPMHLCLCPSCYRQYMAYRKKQGGAVLDSFLNRIRMADSRDENVTIPIEGQDTLTFTAWHLAEIRELLNCYDSDVNLNVSSGVPVNIFGIEKPNLKNDTPQDRFPVCSEPETVNDIKKEETAHDTAELSREESFNHYMESFGRNRTTSVSQFSGDKDAERCENDDSKNSEGDIIDASQPLDNKSAVPELKSEYILHGISKDSLLRENPRKHYLEWIDSEHDSLKKEAKAGSDSVAHVLNKFAIKAIVPEYGAEAAYFSKFSMNGRASSKEHVKDVFGRFCREFGREPSRVELFNYGLAHKEYYQLVDYLSLSCKDVESQIFCKGSVARDFLSFIETLFMNKSYKIPVLLSFLKCSDAAIHECLIKTISRDELYETCMEFYGDEERRWDLILPYHRKFSSAKPTDFELWAMRNPIEFLTNECKWFRLPDYGLMEFAPSLDPYLKYSEFAAHFRDALEYRYERYVFDRRCIIKE